MTAQRQRCQATVLRAVPYGEADLIVHLLTDTLGRQDVYARSARKSAKRFVGGIGPFTLLEVELTPGRDGLGTLRSSDVMRAWSGIAMDLPRVACGSLVLELVDATVQSGADVEGLLDRLVRFFEWLQREPRGVPWLEAGTQRMQALLLDVAGVLPDLSTSGRSGRAAEDLSAPHLVAEVGLIDSSERWPGEQSFALGADACAWFRGRIEGRFPATDDVDARLTTRAALFWMWQHLLGRDLRTRPFFVEGMG